VFKSAARSPCPTYIATLSLPLLNIDGENAERNRICRRNMKARNKEQPVGEDEGKKRRSNW
jgi:hypothetical protein